MSLVLISFILLVLSVVGAWPWLRRFYEATEEGDVPDLYTAIAVDLYLGSAWFWLLTGALALALQ
jgi:hypothetical protein